MASGGEGGGTRRRPGGVRLYRAGAGGGTARERAPRYVHEGEQVVLAGGERAVVDDAAFGLAVQQGKLGGGELNYSSDIDLVLLYDPGRAAPLERDVLHGFFNRLARELVRILDERTGKLLVTRVGD